MIPWEVKFEFFSRFIDKESTFYVYFRFLYSFTSILIVKKSKSTLKTI